MARRKSRWLAVAGIIVVALVALVVAVPFLIPVDTIRDKVIAGVRQSTGRDLSIKGGVSLSLFPTLRVAAKDVALSNASWAGPQPMASLAGLDVRLKLLPLLAGKVAVDSFVLERPQISLATDKQGHGNWQFTPANQPAAQPSGKAAGNRSIPETTLGDVRINDGRLVYTDGATGRSQTVEGINLRLRLADLDAPLSADGSARWQGQDIRLALTADKARDLLQGPGSPLKVGLTSEALRLAFQGKAGANGEADGSLDIAAPSLHDLIQRVGGAAAGLPPMGPFELKGHVAVTGHKAAIEDMQVSLDAIRASGNLAVETGGPRPALSGRLDVDRLDVNPYLPPEQTKPERAPAAGGQTGWSEQPIDVAPLRKVDVDLSLSAGSIAFRKFDIGKTVAKLDLQDGRLNARLQQMALYQGNVHGELNLNGAGGPLAMNADLDVNKVSLEPLVAAAAKTDILRGTAAAQLALSGRGRSERDLIGSLDGRGRFTLTDGAIKQLDLLATLRNLASGGGTGGAHGETQFSQMSASYTITNGIAKNQDLSLVSPELRVSGAGTVDLPQKSLNYRVVPQLSVQDKVIPKELSAGQIPVLVHGPWNNLSYAPDLSNVATRQLGKTAKQLGAVLGGNADELAGAPNKGGGGGGPSLPVPLPIPGLGR